MGRTAKEQVDRELSEIEALLRESQHVAGIGSYYLEFGSSTWKGSDVMDEVFGIDANYPHTAEAWLMLVHPEDREMMASYLKDEVIDRGAPFDKTYRIIRPCDGAVRWVHGLGRLEFGSQGKLVRMLGTIQDVTERKETETALEESKNLLQVFIEQVPVSIAMFDTEMRYLAASRRHYEELNLVGKEIIGRSHYEIFSNLPEHWRAVHRRGLAGESVRGTEAIPQEWTGIASWGQWAVHPWRKADGSVGGMLLFTQRFTNLTQAEIELRESEESLRESQKVASLGSCVIDLRTKVVRCSEMFDRLLGIDAAYPHTEEGLKALIHPGDLGAVARNVEEGAARGRPLDWEYRIVRPSDHAVRWMHVLGRMEPDAQGKPVKVRVTVKDVTDRHETEAALRESKDLLQLLVESAPVSLAMFDREMRYVAASRVHMERYHLTGLDFIGRCYYEMVPCAPDRWRQAHRRCLAGEKVRNDGDRIELPDGTRRWLQWELHPWYTGSGAVGGIIVFSMDITERRQAEERQRLAARVFAHAREGIMIADAQGIIVDVNDMFTEITGYTREEVVGRNPRLLKSGRQKKEFYVNMWRELTEKGSWSGEIWNRDKSGRNYAEMLTISAVPDETGKVQQYVALFSDITHIKEKEQRLKQIAHYDTITGLPNRVLLTDRLNLAMTQFRPFKNALTKARQRGQLMAVAYLDLDWFKEINDRHGHHVGDRLLAAVANRMKSAMRKGDTLARVGGDEFVAVMLDLVNRDACVPMLNRLIEAVATPIKIGKLSLSVSISIGVTFYPQEEEVAADQLMRQADQAMYKAKVAGKNQYHIFDVSEDNNIREHHVGLHRIRKALEKRELVLYYQPLVNMREGKVIGAEALIRWRHPDRGLLLPRAFLPVIEDHPLVVEISEWVIDSALTQMERWHAAGLDIPVSVNVAGRQLQEADFVERLRALLSAHPSIRHSALTLEVVETSALRDIERVSQILEDCRALGVSLALDDFGTGYSSLSHLRHLPADVLKIDWSFVRDILTDPEDLNIIEGIIGLAAAFRRLVIAEGVETVEHGLMLLRMGCDLAQGFGIARPMPGEDLPGWAANWQPDPRWGEPQLSGVKDKPLLHAAVAHRFLVAEVEAYLKGELHSPPQIGLDQCQFSAWLAENGSVYQDKLPELQRLDNLHRRVHSLAEILVRSKDRDPGIETGARVGELQEVNGAFLNVTSGNGHKTDVHEIGQVDA